MTTPPPDNVVPLKRAFGACPVCRRPATLDHRPFCSKRCADVDLSRWLGGNYVIPGDDFTAQTDGEEE